MQIQAHFLTSYPVSLLNRDDAGFAKRADFGGAARLRISSQCLKRAWRDELMQLPDSDVPTGLRSTRIFEKEVLPRVLEAGIPHDRAVAGIRAVLETVVKGSAEADPKSLVTKQPIFMGNREVRFLAAKLAELLKLPAPPAEAQAPKDLVKEMLSLHKEAKKSLAAVLGIDDPLAYGMESALFGRFVTSDVLAATDSSVSVSHAITVHRAATELDFFSVVDDCSDSSGAGHIGDSELGAGLYYLYLSIDVPTLVANLTGADPKDWRAQDLSTAKDIMTRLLRLAGEKSPGAKKGATAPYAAADFMLLEVGDGQPMQLSNAFLKPVQAGPNGLMQSAVDALVAYQAARGTRMRPILAKQFMSTVCEVEHPVQPVDAAIAAAMAELDSAQ